MMFKSLVVLAVLASAPSAIASPVVQFRSAFRRPHTKTVVSSAAMQTATGAAVPAEGGSQISSCHNRTYNEKPSATLGSLRRDTGDTAEENTVAFYFPVGSIAMGSPVNAAANRKSGSPFQFLCLASSIFILMF